MRPLPREEATPPVTNRCLVGLGCRGVRSTEVHLNTRSAPTPAGAPCRRLCAIAEQLLGLVGLAGAEQAARVHLPQQPGPRVGRRRERAAAATTDQRYLRSAAVDARPGAAPRRVSSVADVGQAVADDRPLSASADRREQVASTVRALLAASGTAPGALRGAVVADLRVPRRPPRARSTPGRTRCRRCRLVEPSTSARRCAPSATMPLPCAEPVSPATTTWPPALASCGDQVELGLTGVDVLGQRAGADHDDRLGRLDALRVGADHVQPGETAQHRLRSVASPCPTRT